MMEKPILTDKEIIEGIMLNNEWINGECDYDDGDMMAEINAEEIYDNVAHVDFDELYKHIVINGFDGIFVYKNLVFVNHWNYGCFVYNLHKGFKFYVEHLSIYEKITKEHFLSLFSYVL